MTAKKKNKPLTLVPPNKHWVNPTSYQRILLRKAVRETTTATTVMTTATLMTKQNSMTQLLVMDLLRKSPRGYNRTKRRKRVPCGAKRTTE